MKIIEKQLSITQHGKVLCGESKLVNKNDQYNDSREVRGHVKNSRRGKHRCHTCVGQSSPPVPPRPAAAMDLLLTRAPIVERRCDKSGSASGSGGLKWKGVCGYPALQ